LRIVPSITPSDLKPILISFGLTEAQASLAPGIVALLAIVLRSITTEGGEHDHRHHHEDGPEAAHPVVDALKHGRYAFLVTEAQASLAPGIVALLAIVLRSITTTSVGRRE
jgi:hypothetical protein